MLYHPTSGNAHTFPVRFRPRTCFVMTKLGKTAPPEVTAVRDDTRRILGSRAYEVTDASSRKTGKDILVKIWDQILAVPVGLAVVYAGIPSSTLANVFFELGLMAALGKETLVIRVGEADIPSDFVRTEWLQYNEDFESGLNRFVDELYERAEFFGIMADSLDKDALLAIDYCRRAYLLTGAECYREQARALFCGSGLDKRPKDSVEVLLAAFCR